MDSENQVDLVETLPVIDQGYSLRPVPPALSLNLSEIRGTNSRDVLIGTVGDDTLVGGLGGDTLTGGLGFDRFVYESFLDRTDTITDFNVNEDKIDLTQVFASFGYQGSDPISAGYLKFQWMAGESSTWVQIDSDGPLGSSTFQTMAKLHNVIEGLAVGTNVIVL